MPGQKLAMCIMLVFDNNQRRKILGGSVLKLWGDQNKPNQTKTQDFQNRT